MKTNNKQTRGLLAHFSNNIMRAAFIVTALLVSMPQSRADVNLAEIHFEQLSLKDALEYLQGKAEEQKQELSIVCAPAELEKEILPTIRLRNASVADFLKLSSIVLSDETRDVKVEKISNSIYCLKSYSKLKPVQQSSNKPVVAIVAISSVSPQSALGISNEKKQAMLIQDARHITEICKEALPDKEISVRFHSGTMLLRIKGDSEAVEVAKQAAQALDAQRKAAAGKN